MPEGVAADILGHKKKTLSYGLYSAVSSMQRKREAIEKLVYPGASLWPHARTGGRSMAAPKYATDEERRAAVGKPSASGGRITARLKYYGRRRIEKLTARPSRCSETSAGRSSAKP